MNVFFKIIMTLFIIFGWLFLLFSYLGACGSFAEKKWHDFNFWVFEWILFLCFIICFINLFIWIYNEL